MATKFFVEGRTFATHKQAIAFAEGLAEKLGRAVKVDAELSKPITVADRRWVATMHPPGTKRPLAPTQRMKQKIRAAS